MLHGKATIWIGSFALSVFALFHGGHFYHVDEELHFLVADSILEGNWAAIPTTEQAYYRGQFTGTNSFLAMGKTGSGGRFYAKSGIGQALTVLPLVAAARLLGRIWQGSNLPALRRLVVSFFCPIVASIAVALLFQLVVELGYPPLAASAAVCALAFGTFPSPVRARPLRIQPHRTLLGLPELLPLARRDQRQREPERRLAALPPDQLDAGGDVAPLIAAAGLQRATVVVEQP